VISRLSCKLFFYFNYLTCWQSPWLLVYISIEKFISIVSPTHRLILKKPLFQYTYIFVVYTFSCVFYPYVAIEFDLIQQDNQTVVCNFESYTGQLIINWMFLIASIFLPFFAMILISLMLAIFLTLVSFQQRVNSEVISEKLKKRSNVHKEIFFFNFKKNLVN
jgi:hypothetical protein